MHFLASVIPVIPDSALAILIAMAALIYAVRRWRINVLRRNRAKGPPAMKPSPTAGPALSMREVSSEIHAMLADIEETARRAAAQIDNRTMRLEQLLAEADQKIAQLESLTAPSSPGDPPTAISPAQRAHAASLLSQLRHERSAPAPTEDPAYTPIYQLADQGKSPREIAQTLSRQPGEIELILALRSR